MNRDDYYEDEHTALEEELIHKIHILEDRIATLEHENYELRYEDYPEGNSNLVLDDEV